MFTYIHMYVFIRRIGTRNKISVFFFYCNVIKYFPNILGNYLRDGGPSPSGKLISKLTSFCIFEKFSKFGFRFFPSNTIYR